MTSVVHLAIIRKEHGEDKYRLKTGKLSPDCVSREYTWDYIVKALYQEVEIQGSVGLLYLYGSGNKGLEF